MKIKYFLYLLAVTLKISLVKSLNKNITDFLQLRIEKYSDKLVKAMEENWSNLCNSKCSCSYHSCGLPLPLECNERWSKEGCDYCGSLVNLNYSSLIVGNRFYTVDPDEVSVKETLCAGQPLESLLYETMMAEEMIAWAYFGSYTGVLRIFPGEPVCRTYDSRYRPWYVAATTGVKNIILILDTSNNMDEDKLTTMKTVAKFLLSMLTFNDYAAIVTIGNEHRLFSPYLLRADQAGANYMTNFINSLKINGTANYESAFQTAYDIIDRSEDSERTSGCQQVIILISGGSTQAGVKDEDLLQYLDRIDQQSFFFTYSIGQEEDPFLKKLACHRNGIYENINITNYYPSLLSYFQALGSFINSTKITYSEPYMDISGSGYMTTASLPVFDRSVDPHFVIGVIGLDILMTDLLKIGKIDEIYVAFQEIGSASCSRNKLSPCQVESMRPEKHKCGAEYSKGETTCSPYKKSINKCPNNQLIDRALCNYDLQEKIPECCTQNRCSIVHKYALSIIFGFFGLVGIILLILYHCFASIWKKICCKKCHKKEETNAEENEKEMQDNSNNISNIRIGENKFNFESTIFNK